MKLSEIRKAIKNKSPLIWNDPDPIEGNDYSITDIFDVPSPFECDDEDGEDYILLIHYGECSEAEVYPSEISILKNLP